ncbi:MAG: hypothetical protein U0T84_09380 [Chitinophagales bacterium]
MLRILAFTAILLSLSGCKYSNSWETVNGENLYTMELPSWLDKQDNLKPGASLQYANRFRNIYVVGFSEDKQGTLSDFYKKQTDIIKKSLTDYSTDDSSSVAITGHQAIKAEISGLMQGERIFYSLIFTENGNKYIEACVWTRNEERKLKYHADLERITGSFKLLQTAGQ